MQNDLLKLGLSRNEAKVYICLVHLGESPVGGMIKELKVHRQIVYNALENLISREMVEKTVKNKVTHYRVSDPAVIVENIKQKEALAEKISKQVKKEIGKSPHENIVKVYEGKNHIRRFFLENLKKLPKNSEFYVLSGTMKTFVEVLGRDFLANEYDQTREKRQIKTKVLFSEFFRPEKEEVSKVFRTKSNLREYRFLPYNLPSPVATVIWKNSVGYQFFLEKPFILEIKNKELRSSLLENFKLLWKMAKK